MPDLAVSALTLTLRDFQPEPGDFTGYRDVLPEIERRMLSDYPDQLKAWRVSAELAKAAREAWQGEIRAAQKQNKAPPDPPAEPGPEPQAPRLRQSDVTIERVATLLAAAAPKGLLIIRDELAGWITAHPIPASPGAAQAVPLPSWADSAPNTLELWLPPPR